LKFYDNKSNSICLIKNGNQSGNYYIKYENKTIYFFWEKDGGLARKFHRYWSQRLWCECTKVCMVTRKTDLITMWSRNWMIEIWIRNQISATNLLPSLYWYILFLTSLTLLAVEPVFVFTEHFTHNVSDFLGLFCKNSPASLIPTASNTYPRHPLLSLAPAQHQDMLNKVALPLRRLLGWNFSTALHKGSLGIYIYMVPSFQILTT
jgi:hypothetical protein